MGVWFYNFLVKVFSSPHLISSSNYRAPDALLTCLLSNCFRLGFLNGQEQFELGRQFVFGVESIGKVHPPYPAVGMDLNTERFHVVGPVGTAGEIGQVELDLIPSFVQSHGHGADEWLHPRSRLVIASPKAPPHVFIVQDLAGINKSEKQKMKTRKQRGCGGGGARLRLQ